MAKVRIRAFAEPQHGKSSLALRVATQIRWLGRLLFYRRSSPLEIGIAHGAVKVHGRFCHAFKTVEIDRPFVNGVGPSCRNRTPPGNEIGIGCHRSVESIANAIANGQGRKEWQNQIRAWSHAPDAKSLTGVFVLWFDPKGIFSDIEKSHEPNRAVDRKTGYFDAGAGKFRLQAIMDLPTDHRDVVEHIMDAALHHIGQYKIPRRGDRL